MGHVLVRSGFRLIRVVSRTLARAKEAAILLGAGEPATEAGAAELVLLAVPDDEIAEAASRIRDVAGSVVAHLSGAVSAEVLSPLRSAGARIGALHPLRSFADPAAAAATFAGTYCAVEGEAAGELESIVRALGGIPFRVRTEAKALYHAGAVFASNYLVSLLESSLRFFEAAGVPRRQAIDPILVLAQGTLENVRRIGIPAALSGPIERGDVQTIARHLEALREGMAEMMPAYAELASVTCEVATAKGSIDSETAGKIRALLGGQA